LHICISCIDTELLTEILVMRYGLPLKLRRKIIEFFVSKICNKRIIYYICTRNQATLAYGVIGNTADFGSVVLGSSPSRPTKNLSYLRGFFVLIFWLKNYILKVTTGLTAWLTRSSLMLPLKKCARPFLPCVHIPIRSALILLAKCKIPFSTFTSLYTWAV
jgi:hypothetical protein